MKIFFILFAFLGLTMPGLAQDRQFSLYGFFDLEYEIGNKDEKAKRGTFDQHHFNVVSSFVLDPRFRVLGEIEWEHGFEGTSSGNTGELRLERAWLEYRHSEALKVRAGKYLTPYGIYNLIHDATPTFLSTFLPTSIYGKRINPLGQKQRLYAKFSNGLQVLGTLFSGAWQFDYVAYLANGQGADAFASDDNANKATGLRLLIGLPANDVDLGLSYYTEINGQAAHTRQRNLAFDASLAWGELGLQGELALARLETVDAEGAPTGSYQNALGVYGQVGYTFIGDLTPFFRYEYLETGSRVTGEYHSIAGFNYAVTHRVYLKSEVHIVRFRDTALPGYELFVASVAVAF